MGVYVCLLTAASRPHALRDALRPYSLTVFMSLGLHLVVRVFPFLSQGLGALLFFFCSAKTHTTTIWVSVATPATCFIFFLPLLPLLLLERLQMSCNSTAEFSGSRFARGMRLFSEQ